MITPERLDVNESTDATEMKTAGKTNQTLWNKQNRNDQKKSNETTETNKRNVTTEIKHVEWNRGKDKHETRKQTEASRTPEPNLILVQWKETGGEK